jgi:hypothetical protein
LKRKVLLGLVIFTLVMISLLFSNTTLLVKGDSQGWQVDVYTQKQPYDGAGQNESSDSFAPTELVSLYANVTYNAWAVQYIRVSFQVFGPANPIQNFTLTMSAVSNDVGVAESNFSIPWVPPSPETVVFGYWTVFASIENASDFLVFRVGWIVEIASLNVADQDPPQGGWLQVSLSLQNIAMTPKNVTFALTLSDSANQSIGGLIVNNFTVSAEGANSAARFQIPRTAALGTGKANALVLNPNGAPYSPGRSITFLISVLGDLNGDGKVDVRDVAIVSLAFGSYPEHPRWDPRADINKDMNVDIRDVALVCRAFGSKNPQRDP